MIFFYVEDYDTMFWLLMILHTGEWVILYLCHCIYLGQGSATDFWSSFIVMDITVDISQSSCSNFQKWSAVSKKNSTNMDQKFLFSILEVMADSEQVKFSWSYRYFNLCGCGLSPIDLSVVQRVEKGVARCLYSSASQIKYWGCCLILPQRKSLVCLTFKCHVTSTCSWKGTEICFKIFNVLL